jgi:hypothetical protein
MFQVLNYFETYLKSFSDFCGFSSETSKEKEMRAGSNNFFLISVKLKK